MSEIAVVAAFVKSALNEISKQERALGEGLQNASPGNKAGTPNNSVSYLLESAAKHAEIAKQCDQFMPFQDANPTMTVK